MWSNATIPYFRRAVLSDQRCSVCTCYTLKWNEKRGRAEPCGQNAWQFRNFQIYTAIMTLIVLPVHFARTFQLLTSTHQEKHPDLKIFLVAFTVTDLLFVCIPYLWFFSKSEGLRKLVICNEATFLVDRQIQGETQTLFIRNKPVLITLFCLVMYLIVCHHF